MAPKNATSVNNESDPPRKKIVTTKLKYSPVKKISSKHNICFIEGFKFGLMSLSLKKGSNPSEDAFAKDFFDKLDNDPSVSEMLGIIKYTYVRDSNKSNIGKLQSSGYKTRQILGISPEGKETSSEYRKIWAEKIIDFLNNMEWKYENTFRFRADITKFSDGELKSSLDDVMLDEDIGGFVSMFLYDDVNSIKNNSKIMSSIFGYDENREKGESILLANWNAWEVEN
jgi:hypothetical protein